MRDTVDAVVSFSERSRKLLHPRFKHAKTYHIIVVDTELKQKFFDQYCEQVASDETLQGVCVLDFEFNSKRIATMQLNIELEEESEPFIFVVDPTLFQSYRFVTALLTNPRLTKVLHGGDSLDLPYLQSIMTKRQMAAFLGQLVDTRFICAFVDDRCKIYNMLLDRNIITQRTLDMLEDNEEKMGKIYNIQIDIRKLSPNLLRYAVYDVLFLGYLLDEYRSLPLFAEWRAFVQHTYMEKRGVIDVAPFEEAVARWNIARLQTGVSLFETYSHWWEHLASEDFREYVQGLVRNGFVKRLIFRIIRFMFYRQLASKMTVYESLREERVLEQTLPDLEATYAGLNFFLQKIAEEIGGKYINQR